MDNNYKMCYHYQTITILQLTFTITYWAEVETVEFSRHVREVIGSTLDKASDTFTGQNLTLSTLIIYPF